MWQTAIDMALECWCFRPHNMIEVGVTASRPPCSFAWHNALLRAGISKEAIGTGTFGLLPCPHR